MRAAVLRATLLRFIVALAPKCAADGRRGWPVVEKNQLHDELRKAVRELCARFPGAYWRELDRERAYPELFVKAMTDASFLGALVPEEFGGLGFGVTEASIILEEV